MAEENKPDVFIAHNKKDQEFAIKIAKALEFEDLKPRIDEWEVVPGDSFILWMNETLRESRYLVLIWSKNAAESEWVEKEWSSSMPRFVIDKTIKIIPLLLDDEPLPHLLGDIVYIRYSNDLFEVLSKLLKGIYGPPVRDSQRKVLAALQADLLDNEDPLPVIACPVCGSLDIEKGMDGNDYGRYEVLTAKCKSCSWGTYKDVTHWQPSREEESPYDEEPPWD